MAISLLSIIVRHERRVRLGFSANLGAGAFTSTSFYLVEALDDGGAAPGVTAALAIPSSPSFVELQMDGDLAQGSRYRVYAEAVPAADASITALGSYVEAVIPLEADAAVAASAPAQASAMEVLLYGKDLAFGADFLEGPDGDLAVVEGVACVLRDARATLLSDGLPWDPAHGAHPDRYTDQPAQLVQTFADEARAALLKDDRLRAATATVDATQRAAPVVTVDITLLGREQRSIATSLERA